VSIVRFDEFPCYDFFIYILNGDALTVKEFPTIISTYIGPDDDIGFYM